MTVFFMRFLLLPPRAVSTVAFVATTVSPASQAVKCLACGQYKLHPLIYTSIGTGGQFPTGMGGRLARFTHINPKCNSNRGQQKFCAALIGLLGGGEWSSHI